MSERQPRCIGVLLATLVSATAALAQPMIRQGTEFQVNTYTTDSQYDPSIGVDADGDFVVTWISPQEGGLDFFDVFAARFDSAGVLFGSEFQVNTYTSTIQKSPSVAVESNGDFVIVWQSFGQAVPGSFAVFGQRFTSTAAPLGGEFQINTSTLYSRFPKVASDADGDFVVVWYSDFADPATPAVFGRRYSSSGTALAAEFLVNSHTVSVQQRPVVAVDGDGDFLIAWESFVQEGEVSFGVFAKRYDSTGSVVGFEFQVNTFTSMNQDAPAIAADSDGDFIIAWQSSNQDGDSLGIFARRFTSAGIGQATEFQVNGRTTSYQRVPAVAADDDGDFVVSWESGFQDGSNEGVFARRFTSAGAAFGPEIQVNTWTSSGQRATAIDFDADGDFVIAWYNKDPQDGDDFGVFAQRFSLPPLITLDADGNGSVEPLTDGLLILRHRFGFSGATLTSGAVAGDCLRCDPASISEYLSSLGLVLDIDDNGNLEPLTDALLVLRFSFGFTGASLTQGAVAGDCGTRCDSATILSYLQTLD